ncbi:hypothetical protein FB451DRAFT_1410459 [Mycena latifolia]|nr:hypothetical protein FB451DRAFT_1410459 [Mycena latifolia]
MNSTRTYRTSKAATRVRKRRRDSISPPRVEGPVSCAPLVSASTAGRRRRRYSEPVATASVKKGAQYVEAEWEAGWQNAMAEINSIWLSSCTEETQGAEDTQGEVQDCIYDGSGATDGEGPERLREINAWDATYLAAQEKMWSNDVHIATNMLSEPDRQRMLLDQHREERLERSRAEHYRFHSQQLTWRPQPLPTREMGEGRRYDTIDDMGISLNFYAERKRDEISDILTEDLSTGGWSDFSGRSGEYID